MFRISSLITGMLFTAATAHAAPKAEIAPRPGLWEISASSGLLALVPEIPADQMARLRGLARQHGFDMPKIENGAASSRICITPEMAAQNTMPDLYQQQSGCASRNAVRDGARYAMDVRCDGPRVRGAGRAEGVLESPERFSGTSSFDGTIDGNPIREQAQTSGRWIAASCNGLPPPR